MIDVVMPKNKKDEELFKETALALGWKDVVFLYPDKKNDVVLASQTQISSLKKKKVVFDWSGDLVGRPNDIPF